MLRVVAGPLHPALEQALVHRIRAAKGAHPLTPIVLLVPSSVLAASLRRTLALTHRLSLLNVHILTFHQLSLRLAAEARAAADAGPFPLVVDSLFCEQLLSVVCHRGTAILHTFHPLIRSGGSRAALWATLRDLKDGGVDPAVTLRALDEGCFPDDDRSWLQALFTLHASMNESGRRLNVGTADDLADSLREFVPQSPFLQSVEQILYYGFYDLTQVQLSVFETVAAHSSTTLFFPLEDRTGDTFAHRFFERHVLPLASGPDAIEWIGLAAATPVSPARPAAPTRPPGDPQPHIIIRSAVGAEEELAATCRHILELVETNGYRFDEIGVVARTLEPYRHPLSSVFQRYRVPMWTTCGGSLIEAPLAKLVLLLAEVPRCDAYRSTILDILTSPFYSHDRHLEDPQLGGQVRPDLWRMIVSALSITRGRAEWARLEQAAQDTWSLGDPDREGSVSTLPEIPAPVIRTLAAAVSVLLDDCAALPAHGLPRTLLDALLAVARRHLLPFQDTEAADPAARAPRSPVRDALESVFTSIRELDRLEDPMTWSDFVELLTQAIERATVPIETGDHTRDHGGVAVLNAMDARGLHFRALFLLGLNDHVWPRYIREDPFLRDRHRRVLATTLGYKIDEKLSGYDEEALLFHLLRRSASGHLILSSQRADTEGRILAESPYLSDLARDAPGALASRETVPRRLSDRLEAHPGRRILFSQEELAQWLAMQGQDATWLLEATGRSPALYRCGLRMLDQVESAAAALASCDGITGPIGTHNQRLEHKGLSPTALERYGRCPFQYFCADVLRLEPPPSIPNTEIDPRWVGTLCHAALHTCYSKLIEQGWPEQPLPESQVAALIHEAISIASTSYEHRYQTGPWLLWTLAQEQLRSLIAQAVADDQLQYQEGGLIPMAFERSVAGTLDLGEGTHQQTLTVRGRVDRFDRARDGRVRIVDYKYKLGGTMHSDDRRLAQSALRGTRLQPALYSRMTADDLPPPTEVELLFLAPRWSPPIARSRFEASAWTGPLASRLRRTIRILVQGIHEGRFFMVPDQYCDSCAYRVACRLEHTASRWRVTDSPDAQRIWALRRERDDAS